MKSSPWFFDDGWRIYMRDSSWMIFFQMRKPFLNRKRLPLLIGMICFFLGWTSSWIRRWSLLDYNLEDENAFFCRVGMDCLNMLQDDKIFILRSFEFYRFVDILMRVLVVFWWWWRGDTSSWCGVTLMLYTACCRLDSLILTKPLNLFWCPSWRLILLCLFFCPSFDFKTLAPIPCWRI